MIHLGTFEFAAYLYNAHILNKTRLYSTNQIIPYFYQTVNKLLNTNLAQLLPQINPHT
jgi:hypothetical protein